MTHRSICLPAFSATLAAALLLQPAPFAAATEPANQTQERSVRSSREILLRDDLAPPAQSSWLSPNLQLHKKFGIGYSKMLKRADKPLILRVAGPVLRKQKALGLRFAINF